MGGGVFYNEIDPFAAQWLRNLIEAGLIAKGIVDERSIVDLRPADLAGFTQCHFFAGIGVWSYALRNAGWADDRPVWTGSCPCQPFSAAGQGTGFDDERHLWPAWFHLIQQCQPAVVFGEQVSSKDGLNWFDLVQADMEGAGYAVGALDSCAASVGAPHIRQRLWFVADTHGGDASAEGLQRGGQHGQFAAHGVTGLLADAAREQHHRGRDAGTGWRSESSDRSNTGGLGNPGRDGDRQHARELSGDEGQHEVWTAHGDHASLVAGTTGRLADDYPDGREVIRAARLHEGGQCGDDAAGCRETGGMGDTMSAGLQACECEAGRGARPGQQGRAALQSGEALGGMDARGRSGPVNGYWRGADWIFCRDNKFRPVGSGTFPLVDGAAGRVGRLRAYGNAIVAEAAEAFIASYLDVRAE